MVKFIVLAGKKQSGKTTAANFIKEIIEKFGYEVDYMYHVKNQPDGFYLKPMSTPVRVIIESFATPIKKFCRDILGIKEEQICGAEEQKNSDTHIKWDTMPDEIRQRYGKDLPKGETVVGWHKIPRKGPMTAREVMQIFGTDVMRNLFDYNIWAKVPFKKRFEDYVIIDDCRFPNEADIALKHDALLIKLERNILEDIHLSEKALDNYPKENYSYIIDNKNISLDELKSSLREILLAEKIVYET
jgi:hypothetical protein